MLAQQAREVRFVLPLDVLKGCQQLFRDFRELAVAAKLGHEPGLMQHTEGALADMALNHLQLGFFFLHAHPAAFRNQQRLAAGSGQAKPDLTEP